MASSRPGVAFLACIAIFCILCMNLRLQPSKQLLRTSKVRTSQGLKPQSCSKKRTALKTLFLSGLAVQQQLLSKAENIEPMESLKGKGYGKTRMRFSDYDMTSSGLQIKDMKLGNGKEAKQGDTCIIDWSGYTIGYYGRPFEARDKAKGGAFTGEEKELFRFVLGENKVIPAFEEALQGMREGGIRRIVVPVELGYPDNDMKKKGPKPTTFSGKRALGFVLENQGMIDKTLLFDIELIKVK